jgi:o-succinylbenzoate synthase
VGVQLLGVEVWRVPLRLERPLASADLLHDERPVIYVRILSDGGEGWGESAALPSGTSVDPPHAAVWSALVDHLVPELVERSRRHGGELPRADRSDHGTPAWTPAADRARRSGEAALDMALEDLELRRRGLSLAARWGAAAGTTVEVGTVLGIPADRDVGRLVGAAVGAVDAGYRRLRLKIAPGWDLVPLRALRQELPSFPLQADANASYRWGGDGPDDVRRLLELDELSLTCLEQPLAPDDLRGHARLAASAGTPIGLDESADSADRLEAILSIGACSVVCIKADRFGSLEGARRAVSRCREHGVGSFVGGFFETGLARAANLALASVPGCSLPGDLSDPATYLRDPCGYPSVHRGRVSVPLDPGVGRPPDRSVLEELGASRRWIPLRELGGYGEA